ncbi:MAG: 30S ribosomal protein S1 [Rhodothermales bacterium]
MSEEKQNPAEEPAAPAAAPADPAPAETPEATAPETTADTETPEAAAEAEAPAAEEAPATEAEAPATEESTLEEAPVAEATEVEKALAEKDDAAEATAPVELPSATVEPPSEDGGPDTSLTEEAIDEVLEGISVEDLPDAGKPTFEIPDEAVTSDDLPEVVGYTGEITGRVVKLEDLVGSGDDEEESGNFDDLIRLIDSTLTNVSEHEIVRGRVVSIGEKDVVIDIGFKSDGIVAKNEFEGELEPGSEVDVFLERLEDYHGQLVLSKTKADKVRRWERIESAFENEEVLEGVIIRRIKGGMIAELFDGVEAFLPGSQIDVRPVRDFDAYLERRMEFKIVKLNPANENIVVSHKALIEKDLQAQREKILSTMEPGQVLEGTVKNITDFGVFIDLGGVDGLLHITDLSWGRVSHPSELVSLDDKLNVVVLDYDKERQRISLGLKQLQPHPWENLADRFSNDDVVEGKVVSITDYGAFVELEKGIEGLVHISEMSWTEHIKHPSQMVSLGQIVPVKILNIDHDGRKISLGMKQLEPDPWNDISQRYPAGTVLNGRVRNITNFGVFVEIEPGIDGLVHISDLSWTKRIRHPGEFVKKGQPLDVVILNIDENDRRISLGHKQVSTNPWTQFAQIYAEGTDAEVKVARVIEDGLIVELPLEVEGFVPARELKNNMNTYRSGEAFTMRVIRFDANQKEIILSQTAKDRAEQYAAKEAEKAERRAERMQQTREVKAFKQREEATSGPTTIAELSGLADLKAKLEAQEAAADAQEAEAPAEAAEEAPEATPPAEAVAEASDAAPVEDTPPETTGAEAENPDVVEADEAKEG